MISNFITNTGIIERKRILSFLFLMLIQIFISFFLGLENYQVVTVTVLMLLSIPIIVNPLWGILILLFITLGLEGRIIEGFILFRLLGFNWYIIDFLFFIIFISLLFNIIMLRFHIKWSSLLFWLILLFVGLLFSVYFGLKNGNGSSNVFHDFRGYFYYIILLPTYFVINSKKKNLEIIFWSIIIFSTIKSLVDSYLSIFVLHNTYDPAGRLVLNFARLTGYSDVVYPVLTTISIVYFFLTDNVRKKILLVLPILSSTMALFLSYKRGSWLGVVVALSIFFALLIFRYRDKIKLKYLLIFVLSTSLLFFLLDITDVFSISTIIIRATSISAERIDTSNLGRIIEWATALQYFTNNPIFGGGLGLHVNYYAPGMGYKSTIFIHNSYVFILSKAGLVGFIPFIGFLFSNLATLKKVLRTNLENEDDKIVFTFLIVLIFMLVKGFTTWHLNMWTFTPFLGIMFGAIYSKKVSYKYE